MKFRIPMPEGRHPHLGDPVALLGPDGPAVIGHLIAFAVQEPIEEHEGYVWCEVEVRVDEDVMQPVTTGPFTGLTLDPPPFGSERLN